MRINRLLHLALGCAIALLSAACGSTRRGEPFTGELDRTSPAIQSGQAAFQRHCHSCHPGGEGGLGPSLNDKPAPKWLMKTQVRTGLGAMPSFDEKQIPPAELDNLVEYVVALRRDRP